VSAPEPDQVAEVAADWDQLWDETADDAAALDADERGVRWRAQQRIVQQQFGSTKGLRVIEIGAGRAGNALLYARNGANATVLDSSPVALDQARRRFAEQGLEVEAIEADLFELPRELLGQFDVSMSFGVCEHFLGQRRRDVVAAHIELLRPGGVAMINVPNRLSPIYRLWMKVAKTRGTWKLGTEVPFSGAELCDLAKLGGGLPLQPFYAGGLGTLVSQGLNALLTRVGLPPLPVPQVSIWGLDLLAYDLLVPVVRPLLSSDTPDRSRSTG
jgi:2-polyprenyl-3-methyl-5-hydroxy-6-metoxy-1,4-benzoquinol methylase